MKRNKEEKKTEIKLKQQFLAQSAAVLPGLVYLKI